MIVAMNMGQSLGRMPIRRTRVRRPATMGVITSDTTDASVWNSITDFMENAWHGNITTGQAADIRRQAISDTLNQPGWANLPASQKQQTAATLDSQIKKIQDDLAAQQGGYADQQGFWPNINGNPMPSWVPWAIGGGAVVFLWLVFK